MGYTTKFKGEFIITPYPTEEFVETINLFSSKRHNEENYPGIWCQWIINSNGRLLWNGGEKFSGNAAVKFFVEFYSSLYYNISVNTY